MLIGFAPLASQQVRVVGIRRVSAYPLVQRICSDRLHILRSVLRSERGILLELRDYGRRAFRSAVFAIKQRTQAVGVTAGRRVVAGVVVWVNRPHGNNQKRTGAVVKSGRDVIKTVVLEHYGRPESSTASTRSLRFSSYDRRGDRIPNFEAQGPGKASWYCENHEIDKVAAFLNNEVGRTGRYRQVDRESPVAALAGLLNDDIDPQTIVDALAGHAHLGRIVSLLAASDAGISAAESAVLDRRREVVARLRRLVDDPNSTETQVQNLIGNAYWIFGGHYV